MQDVIEEFQTSCRDITDFIEGVTQTRQPGPIDDLSPAVLTSLLAFAFPETVASVFSSQDIDAEVAKLRPGGTAFAPTGTYVGNLSLVRWIKGVAINKGLRHNAFVGGCVIEVVQEEAKETTTGVCCDAMRKLRAMEKRDRDATLLVEEARRIMTSEEAKVRWPKLRKLAGSMRA